MVSEMIELPDHGEHLSVYGRHEVIGYEVALGSALQNNPNEHETLDSFKQGIQVIREDMQGFSGSSDLNSIIDNYFSKPDLGTPDILSFAKDRSEQESGSRHTWTEWLATNATDDQIVNFLQWHSNRHETIANGPEFHAWVEQGKTEFINRTNLLVDSGLLHSDVLDVAPQRVAEVKVTSTDIFHSYMIGQIGFSSEDGKEIEIVESSGEEVLWHEMKHIALERPNDPLINDEWAREANAEHIAQVMIHGGEQIINPDFRSSDEVSTYHDNRRLLARLMDGIDIGLVTRYYSAQSDEAMSQTQDELYSALYGKFGTGDIIHKIGEFIDQNSIIEEDGIKYIDEDKLQAVMKSLIDNPSIAFS